MIFGGSEFGQYVILFSFIFYHPNKHSLCTTLFYLYTESKEEDVVGMHDALRGEGGMNDIGGGEFGNQPMLCFFHVPNIRFLSLILPSILHNSNRNKISNPHSMQNTLY